MWERDADGTYSPGDTEVKEETDTTFVCAECEAEVTLDDETLTIEASQ